MNAIKKFYLSFYLAAPAYIAAGVLVLLFVYSYFFPAWLIIGQGMLGILCMLIVFDTLMLYAKRKGILARRNRAHRAHLGEQAAVNVFVTNNYNFGINVSIIDEVPPEFANMKWKWRINIPPGGEKHFDYSIKINRRGEYNFGAIRVFVRSPFSLVTRRYTIAAEANIHSYPSTLNLKRYTLQGIASNTQETGVKKLRRLGHSMEFEQIKKYVKGDDFRTINWKATSRQSQLMVNTYTEEKSQQVYCIIDKSRSMKMPFEGMTLLDYAVNSSLVVSNVVLNKQDRVGLVTFANKMGSIVHADRKPLQMEMIQNTLYNLKTDFKESSYEALYGWVRNKIKQRSLLILFTNFETVQNMQHRLQYLRALNHHHLLMVVFFENTGVKTLREQRANSMEDIYIKTIADKFDYEKRLIVKELQKNGIITVLTSPKNLTIDAINKYLEIKMRHSI